MPNSWVDINVDGQTMEGYLTQPEAEGRYPAVIVIQEIWGVNSHIQSVTDRLPSQGYVVLAPAMFHCDGRSSYRPEAATNAWGKTLAWFDQYLEG